MTLNYSHIPVLSVPENDVVSSLRRNGRFVEGVPESNGEGFGGSPWVSGHQSWERSDNGFSQEAGVDIVDLLPADPFGMEIFSDWLEDLEFSYCNGCERDCEGGYSFITGLNLLWSNALRFPELQVNVGGSGDSTSNVALVGVDGSLAELSNNVGFGKCDEEGRVCYGSSGDCVRNEYKACSASIDVSFSADDDLTPNPALIFALGYLGVQDLLSSEMVCRTFRSLIVDDPLLWRNIRVDQPLNERITDDVLLQLTDRAQGSLKSLTLVECSRITDDCLKLVIERNPRLTQLSVPGCTRLSIEGIISILKASKSISTHGIKQLRVGGLYGVTHQHFEELKFLLNVDDDVQQGDQKPRFYQWGNFYLSGDDGRAIDIEVCPKCQNLRLVYDCPSDGCQVTENSNHTCRACTLCIARCVQCGRCIDDSEYEETFCLELLCSDCGK